MGQSPQTIINFQFPLIRLQIVIGDIELDIAESADMNGTLIKLKSGQGRG
ncbi:hypothetical protein [Nostoc sp. FACHB-888]|nr:hypothetical protein [Nostoc sp. FACHB-888]MBD2248053.1 hypothetical protein [Nostoc sp. FACHB-888]